VVSLNRELQAVLASEEAADIGRAIAQIVRGDGWLEARASAVLTDAVAAWLGRDAVQTVGFYADGIVPVEVVARAGSYFITAHGIETEGDLLVACCERHRARHSQSRLDSYDLATGNSRFNWGSPPTQRAADRLASLLGEGIDAEVARVVLGVL
jgi:hypothetical protein